MAAKISQAGIINGVDVNSDRLEIANSLGATHVINNSDGGFRVQIKDNARHRRDRYTAGYRGHD